MNPPPAHAAGGDRPNAGAAAADAATLRFVLLGIQRSGTTFLRRCLDSHPQVRCRGELFARSYGQPEGYFHWYREAPARRVGHWLWRGRQVRQFLRARLRPEREEELAVGFKLMRSQLTAVPWRFPAAGAFVREQGLHEILVVRRNVLKTVLSRHAARQRRLYHASDEVAGVRLHLAPRRLLAELEAVARENRYWERYRGDGPRLRIDYEDFVQDPSGQSRRLLDFLGVDAQVALSSPGRKLNPDRPELLIANYEEVAAALAASPWGWCLAGDDPP